MRMNKRGEDEFGGSLLMEYVVYFILLGLFLTGAVFFVYRQLNGAGMWSDIYAKELAIVLNGAEEGDRYVINVHKATRIALSNEIPFEQIFSFDAVNGKACVSLSKGSKSCYPYFNNLVVEEKQIKLAQPENMLVIKIGKKSDLKGDV